MALRMVVGLAAIICGVVCAIASGMKTWSAAAKVNSRLPPGQTIDPLGWHVGKHGRLRREYRRLYPGDNLMRAAFRLELAFFACLLIGFWALHVYFPKSR